MCFSADGALTSLSTCGWQAAANCHVRITRVVPYDFTPFPGYCVTGRHGEQKTFRSTGALLHVIQRETHPSPIPERLARMQVADRAPTERWGSSDYCAQVVDGVPPFVASRIAHSAKHITPNAAHPSMRLIRRSCEQLRAASLGGVVEGPGDERNEKRRPREGVEGKERKPAAGLDLARRRHAPAPHVARER